MKEPEKGRGRGGPKAFLIGAGIVLVATAAFALSRVGLFDLPSVPGSVTVEAAGLDRLDEHRQLDQFVRGRTDPGEVGELIVDPMSDPKKVARNTVRDCIFKVKRKEPY